MAFPRPRKVKNHRTMAFRGLGKQKIIRRWLSEASESKKSADDDISEASESKKSSDDALSEASESKNLVEIIKNSYF